jgi:uncharacterized protein
VLGRSLLACVPEELMMRQQQRTGGSESKSPMQLKNDTVINVAQLMKEDVGASRKYELALDRFSLDDDLIAKDVRANLRLMRITRGILASGRISGLALVECHRCLEMFEQPFETDFDHEYRPTIDVRSGLLVDQPNPDEELGLIDEAHELDLSEPMRQVAILDLPIKLICGEQCPGLGENVGDDEDDIDRRLEVLEDLLGPEDDATTEK